MTVHTFQQTPRQTRRTARVTQTAAAALLAVVASASPLFAQAPAKTYAIENARIVTLAGAPIENGTLVIVDGKIAAVGAGVAVPAGAERIDGKGLQIYPGFFDAATQLGLTEVGAVRATVDTNELGDYNPQLVAAMAVHPASDHIPVARANGITHAMTVPGTSGVIAGQASVIALNGWTVEEMLIAPSAGMIVNWPQLATSTFDFTTFSQRSRPFTEVKAEYDKKIADLTEWIARARRYQQAVDTAAATTPRDLKLEAMLPVIKGERPLIISANRERAIRDALKFCEEQKLRVVIYGGDEARKVKDLLAKQKVPVILGPTLTMPSDDDEPYDSPFTLPSDLHKAGIKVALATFNSADSRTLPYETGNAVAYGLPHEEGLKAISLYPAQIFGLDKQLGTIETGKIANVIVTSGDPLELTTEVKYLFIKGQLTSLDNKHQRSYETWRSRPRPTGTTRTTASK